MIRASKVKRGQGWKSSEKWRKKGKEWRKERSQRKRKKILRERWREKWPRERQIKQIGEEGEGKTKGEREECNFQKDSSPPSLSCLGLSPGPGRLEAADLPALLGASAGLVHTALACSSTP